MCVDQCNNDIIPEVYSLSGVLQTWNTSTHPITHHKQPQKQTPSLKKKQNHTFNISDIHTLRKTPKFSSHPFTSLVRINPHCPQVSLPYYQYFISELNHSAHTEPCMDISSTFLKLPDPRFRPLNSTVDPQHIPIVQQTHLIPNAHVVRWALCHTEQEYIT